MTQREVYEHLLIENRSRIITRMLHPSAPENFIEIAERKAIITTIQQAWYWFNHQDEFISRCFFPVSTKSS